MVLKQGCLYVFEHETAEFAAESLVVEDVPCSRDSSVTGQPRADGCAPHVGDLVLNMSAFAGLTEWGFGFHLPLARLTQP